ncbi:FAD-binding oxidoreductase [Pseudomonas sp. PDNC002]|uniref:FAD-binding oxidoreductase n=1 Tax=Pseudomonas sp. PDNC002 TaxID=2811422 RepID=UPI001963BB4F|nr:FAD-binding oxidoreductase [Pseudomonas sp. PDNC002]QRY79068.1 FAD-binding oxidoreductase [Pseudomonas sp. PDNC002]
MRPINSWGRLDAPLHEVIPLSARERVVSDLQRSQLPGLAHGMGRSYGDVCLNPNGTLWTTTGMDHLLRFDEQSGRLTCEAGVLLRDIQRLMVPRGWMLPVTPGTQLVTVGGAIANDVHGKNHHVCGSFGDHVKHLTLARTDGTLIECGPEHHPDWFAATVGGMGLTGVIVAAELQLRKVASPWLDTETIPYANLDEFFALADGSEANWEQTVSWIDCLSGSSSRGIFMRANPAETGPATAPKGRRMSIPFVPPVSLVNGLSLRPFNAAYFYLNQRRAGRSIAHYEPFSYPLDNVLEWNRMYGPKGFYQYQSVVPRAVGRDAVQAMLQAIASAGEGSFLAVLKTFGNRHSLGMLGFPQPGVTLALDFPNRGERTLGLLRRLDAIVAEAGGRLYAAKDARMPRELFLSGYPRLTEFNAFRDPGISSGLSRRLLGS